MQQSKVSVKYSEENSVFGRVSYYLLLEFLWEGVGWGGRLFEAGRLSTFSAFRMGAYPRWALIRGWALNRINTVCCLYTAQISGTRKGKWAGQTASGIGREGEVAPSLPLPPPPSLNPFLFFLLSALYFLQHSSLWKTGTGYSMLSYIF